MSEPRKVSTRGSGRVGQLDLGAPSACGPTIDEMLLQVDTLYRAGRWAQAVQLCDHVLRTDNRRFDAWHLRGALEAQKGNAGRAVQLFDTAIAINPRS